MFGPTHYLEWARRYYGKVRYDLATSGIPTAPRAVVGTTEAALLDDPSGVERLREAIAAYNDVPSHEAIATLGTTHALWLTYSSLISPGDEVLVEAPVFEPLVRIAEGVGARVISFERRAREGFALDPDRIARAMTPRTRIVALTNLHNPSGIRASDASLRAVAAVAAEHGAHVLIDEVYAPFDDLVNANGVFLRTGRKLAPNVVAVSSLTKCYGLGPERIGWLLGPAGVVGPAEDAMTASCGMLPLAHAHLAAQAFTQIVALAERSKTFIERKRERVAEWALSEGFEWSAPDGGLFGFVTVPGAGDLTSVLERAAREDEVLVAPGAFFGIEGGFRVAWSAPASALEEGLARLARVLHARSRRGPGE